MSGPGNLCIGVQVLKRLLKIIIGPGSFLGIGHEVQHIGPIGSEATQKQGIRVEVNLDALHRKARFEYPREHAEPAPRSAPDRLGDCDVKSANHARGIFPKHV